MTLLNAGSSPGPTNNKIGFLSYLAMCESHLSHSMKSSMGRITALPAMIHTVPKAKHMVLEVVPKSHVGVRNWETTSRESIAAVLFKPPTHPFQTFNRSRQTQRGLILDVRRQRLLVKDASIWFVARLLGFYPWSYALLPGGFLDCSGMQMALY